MVTLARKRIGGRDYYYLQHTLREAGGPVKKELYLGPRVPRDVEARKGEFLAGLYRPRWAGDLERIRKGFAAESGRLPPSAARKEREEFAIRFTYNTQRIEGSTLTLRETADLLERGIAPSRRPVQDVREAEAHKALLEAILRSKKDLSRQAVLEWHWRLFRGTKPDIAGLVRLHQVRIGGSRFVPPSPVEVEPMLRDFFRWYARNKAILPPVELAARAHLKFVTVHPFADGNGRVSRLLMNAVLHRRGYPMLDIPYSGRAGYYRALERSQLTGNEFVFVRWLVKAYRGQYRRFLG